MQATEPKSAQVQYVPRYKPHQVICGKGHTVIVTGWTPRQLVAKHLEVEEYAAIGQLYSPTRGINFLARNLLFNPQVKFLVVINATKEDKNAGGGDCLLDFFRHGFERGVSDAGRICWVIKSRVVGYIDCEIDAQSLANLRQLVCREATSVEEAVKIAKAFAKQDVSGLNRTQLEFPQPEISAKVLPGRRYGHCLEGKTIAETWVKIIHRIKTTGTIRPTGYDGKWQELIDLTAVVTEEPEEFYFPSPNYLPCDREFIEKYLSLMLDDAPYKEGTKYTYGQRLRSWFGRDQIEQVIQKLIGEIDAASAVMNLWDVKDHETGGSPCLNHIWVRVVEGELSLTATFRSNDMFSAWPANAMGLRALQKHIVERVGLAHQITMGPLITISQSAHIYDDCWENADKLIQDQYLKICRNRTYFDPCGSFTIKVQSGAILVEHLTPGSGEVVGCYSGRKASRLCREIASNCPGLETEHALYLGGELQKAQFCLENQLEYEQDREKAKV